jgi:AraC-like DNA-binding protein
LRLFPDGCVDLVWNGRDLIASGPSDIAMIGRLQSETTNIGLRLHAGAAGAVLGVPAWWLRRRTVRLRDVRSSTVVPIEAALTRAATNAERRLVLEAMIVQIAKRSLNDAVREAVARLNDPTAQIRLLAAHLSIGERELRRVFAENVGLSPKALQRVLRFNRLLKRLPELAARHMSAASLAADLGYADQAHMSRECRRIAGESPLFLARRQTA